MPPTAAPTLVTDDRDLRGAVERLAAAAGVRLVPAADDVTVLARWHDAPVLLVGADRADDVARLRPSARSDVHVVVAGEPGTAAYRAAVALGAASVLVLPDDAPRLGDLLALHEETVRSGAQVAVLGGAGGVGATTFAAALATTAAASGPTLAVDLDPRGPGLDRHLGLDLEEGLRWDALALTAGRLSGRALREAVPRRGGLGVLAWSPVGEAGEGTGPPGATVLREVLAAGTRGHDLVVLDLPRAGEGVPETVVRSDLLVLVVRPTLTGVASARRTLGAVGAAVRVAVVLRGRGIAPGDVAAALGHPVVGAATARPRDLEAVDLGLGGLRVRGALARTSRDVLDLLAVRGGPAAGAAGVGGVGA